MIRGALRTFAFAKLGTGRQYGNKNNNNNKRTFSTISGHLRSSSKLTSTTECNGVREIVLNDEKTRNSLSMAMMESILADLTRDWDNKDLRCIVISSNGPVFSAGHNLKELVPEKGADYHRNVFAKCSEIIINIMKAPVPIIAKVDGLAAAAGLQLVSSCDIVVCSTQSTFSTPGVNFGIFCSTPGIAIARVVPRMMSSYMLFTGLPVTAKQAYDWGLVSSAVPPEKLDEEVNKICSAIMAKSREVVKLGKEFFYKQIKMELGDAYRAGANIMTENLQLEDGKEGIQSFVQKRKPQWKS